MRLLRIMLPLLALLIGSVAATADYNPTNPPEPGVNFLLTTRSVPEGAVYDLTASATHAFGTSVSLGARANTGFRFVRWEDEDGNEVSASSSFTYTMPARDVTLTARFVYDPSSPSEPSTPEFKSYSTIDFKVYPSGAGYFSSNYAGKYEVGTTHGFWVYANTNYRFINWTCDGIEIGTSSTLEYTIPSEDKTLVANFEYNPGSPEEPGAPHFYRTLTLQSNPPAATSSLNGGGEYLDGSSHRVYGSANQYYHFVNWTDEQGEVVSETFSFNYTMPNRDVTLTANFTHDYNPENPEEPGVPDQDGSIGNNMVAWPRMGMYDDTHVQILCETPGAVIHYTLDGSTPTASSPVYTAPVFVGSNLLVKAIAYKEGMDDSPVVSYQVSVYHAGTPVFTFENRMIKITSDTPDAIIRYTLDFTDPNEESDVYTSPLDPVENCRIKAYASKEGLTDSPVSIYVFRRGEHTLPAPTFSVNDDDKLVIISAVRDAVTHYTVDGSEPDASSPVYSAPVTISGNGVVKAYSTHINYYDSPVSSYSITGYKVETPTYSFENPLLTLSTATEGAEIRYTLDGTDPGEDATLYTAPIRLTADCTVTARGFKADNEPSDPVSFTYVYADYQLPVPTASFAEKLLTLSCEDSEAEIRYTTDGSEPTHDSTLYEGPIALSEDCTVRFIAVREHYNDSEAGSYEFKLSDHQAAKPALAYDSDNLLVTITCDTENAEIRYTTDGTVPTATTGEAYTAPIAVVGNHTYTAVAFRSDLFDSEAATLTVDDQQVPVPTASFSNKELTLTCADSQAEIRYTNDGSAPTHTSALYEGPIALSEDCTVRFIGVRANYNDSEVGSYQFRVSDHQAATPVFSYDSDNHRVTITSSTEDAEIRYTTDGTVPTATTGEVYTAPIAVEGNVTITAVAFRSDLFDSEAATLTVDDQQVPVPTASFANKELTLTCADSQAEIRYTTDGSAPTHASALYEGPIVLSEDCTVRFIGVRENYNDSEVGSYEFRVSDHQVATPVLAYDSERLLVTITSATEDAEIRYTTDGTVPTATTGEVYTAPIAVEGNVTITAVAFRSDLFDSEAATLTVDDQQVPVPTASFGNRELTLTCADSQAEIRYTTDGSAPTHASALYEGPIALSEDCTVRFIGVRENYNDSEAGSYEFKVSDHQAATPVFSYDSDNHRVTITSTTENAEIRYTTDGTVPTATTGESYTAPIAVVGNQTYTAVAFRSDLFDSDAATLTVDDQQVPVPTASFSNRELTLTCSDSEAEIRYTTDGSAPTHTSALYDGPIALTENCTVKFIGVRENYNDSEVGSYEFRVSDHQVATPVLAYDSERLLVTITSATEDAEIRYTTDGTVPTATTGESYTAPIAVVGNQTYTAVAFRSDLFDSEAATLTVDDQQVPVPTASFSNRELTLTCSDSEAEIRYTTDGSAPTHASALYEGPIALSSDCTVRFIGVREHFNDSEAGSYEFKVSDHQVATPVLAYDSERLLVTITSATENAEIRYTTDGTVPTATTGESYTAPIAVVGNQTYTAVAFRSDLFDSEAATLTVDDQQVPVPTASFGNRELTLTCSDSEAEIRYTTDGSAPTHASALYEGPIALSSDCTVRFIGVREHFNDSEVGSYEFKVSDHQVATPVLAYDSERLLVTISSATENAEIRYTTDGTVPTATTGESYTAPIAVVGNQTYTAVAFRSDLFDSEAATLTVDDQRVPVPTASFSNRHLTLTCEDSEAEIRYTTDGSAPTHASALYDGPIALTENCTVKFIGVREHFHDSEVGSYEFRVSDHQVATPVLAYDSERLLVTITSATEDAEIRYTTDGTVPTATTGESYTAPIAVVGNQTYTAVAFRSDLFDSEAATLTVDDQQVPVPTASFSNRELTLTCSDSEAEIRYTTDGSAPTHASALYEGSIALTENCTVKFIGVRENYNDSEVGSYEFRVSDHQVATPVLAYDSERLLVTITSATENAEIRYTTDGTVPTATTGESYTAPIAVVGNQTYTAVAFRSDLFDSEAATLTVDDQQVPVPTASFSNRELTLTCSDSEAEIRYTTDGSAPTHASALYEGSIALTENCTVKFIGVRENYNDSEVGSYEFRVSDHQVATPVLAYDSERLLVTITSATEDAEIRYTTDGTVPTATTGESYTAPIAVVGNQTYTAVAFRSDLFDSDAATLTVDDQQVPVPTASFSNRELTLTCSDSEAEIRYTTDGSAPTHTSALYDGPIALTENCTVKFIGVRENYNDSEVGSYEFRVSDHQVATPVLAYDSERLLVTITSATEDAEIRYTTDGTVPTATTGESYTAPIAVVGNQTYTAVAFRSDLFDSEAATLTVDDQRVPVPTASFSNRELTLTCSDSEAEIRYTTDGSSPTHASALYEGSIALSSDCTVRFIGVREHFNDSEAGSYEFKVSDHQVATPVLAYDSERLLVTISSATEDAEIRYTTDGTVPTATTGEAYTAPIAVVGNHTYTAVAFRSDLFDSEAATLTVDDQQVPTPEPRFGNRHLTLTCSDSEAEIRYTTDGSAPIHASALYDGPIALSADCTVLFIGVREHFHDSEAGSYEFRVSDHQVATPEAQYHQVSPLEVVVEIACSTEDAEIRYTIDGEEPTSTTGEAYSGPFEVIGNHRIQMRAFRSDLYDSEVGGLEIDDQRVPTPEAYFENRRLTIYCPDFPAEIYYSIDGGGNMPYEEPIALTEDCTVSYIGTLDRYNFIPSEEGHFEFRVADHQVAQPRAEYDSEALVITASCGTEGAEIRYTIDGEAPTATTGEAYTGPIPVVGNHTYILRGFRSDLFDSEAATLTVDDQQVPTPEPSFGNRHLTLTCADNEAEIRYTTDGSAPTHASALYEGPIALSADCTVLFIGVREHFHDSEAGSYEFRVSDHQVATPEAQYHQVSPLEVVVEIACSTEDAEIRYTIDGEEPTSTTGEAYSGPFEVIGNHRIQMRAFRSDLYDSEVGGLEIDDQRVPTPEAYFENRRLTIYCPDFPAEIYYSIDGGGNMPYEEPIALTEDCTVSYIGTLDRYNFIPSEEGHYEFRVADHQVAQPRAEYDSEALVITASCGTEGAEIRYTIDGEAPTATTGEAYTGPIPVVGNHTYILRGFRSDLFDSEAATLTVDDQQVPTPEPSFGNRHLTLTCSDSEAEIRYTTDGSAPTHASALYEGPIALSADCTVLFIGVREHFHDSEAGSYEFRVSDHQVATPEAQYHQVSPLEVVVEIACSTEDAEIRYTIDGEEPTSTTGEAYSGPFEVIGNHRIQMRAFRSDLYDSEVGGLEIDDQRVPTPEAYFENRRLTIYCPDFPAEIYYSIDGGGNMPYEEPIALTEDCTVSYIGTLDRYNFIPSEEGHYEFRVADHQVAQPRAEYDSEALVITASCGTEGAEIRYTIDGEAPTATTGEAYTEPIPVVGNHTYILRGFRSDLFDSEAATLTVDDQQVPTPEPRYGNRHLTLTCDDSEAQIHYTVNGDMPTAASTLYEAPIPMSADCTVRFIAIREYFHDSNENQYEFVLAEHQEEMPSIDKNFPERLLTIDHPRSLDVRVRIGDIETVVSTPRTIEVTPDMENISVIAIARDEDLYDSPERTEAIVFHLPPKPHYDGHAIYGTADEADPYPGAAVMRCSFDGIPCDGGTEGAPVEIYDFGTVTIHAESDSAFRSEPTVQEIDCFNTGSKAGVRRGHRLAEVFGTWDNGATVYHTLDVTGELEREDLEFIATLPALTALHIESSRMTVEPCDGVFAGTRIEAISANAMPEGMLKGMTRLTNVVWTPADRAMPEGRIADASNPNILLWTSEAANAPADAANVVTYDGNAALTATNAVNSGVTGRAESITLHDKCPYDAFLPVDVEHVAFHKEFTQPTEIEMSQGWETMVIPFTATTIMHETRGEITPYMNWISIDTDPKPFWLYRASESGWVEAGVIEAGVPYIISMPNNPEYIYAFNLAGHVTFSADNVWLGTDETLPQSVEWQDGMLFEPTYMPVEGSVLSLNVGGEGGFRNGSMFVSEARTQPFGCYLSNTGTRRSVPVFGEWNGIIAPTVASDDLKVDSPAPGTLRITSGRDRKVGVYTPTGMVVSAPMLKAGEPEYIGDLAKGIYIVGGKKVMVK